MIAGIQMVGRAMWLKMPQSVQQLRSLRRFRPRHHLGRQIFVFVGRRLCIIASLAVRHFAALTHLLVCGGVIPCALFMFVLEAMFAETISLQTLCAKARLQRRRSGLV